MENISLQCGKLHYVQNLSNHVIILKRVNSLHTGNCHGITFILSDSLLRISGSATLYCYCVENLILKCSHNSNSKFVKCSV